MFGANVAIGVILPDDVGKTMAVVPGEILIDRIEFDSVFLALICQICQRSFKYLPARAFFFDIGSALISETEDSNQPGKRQSLQNQGHENYAESKKDDQIALRKRASIRQSLRQGNSGDECNHSPHSSPTQDQDALHGWTSVLLMKQAGPGPIGDVRAGKYPDYSQRDYQRAEQSAIEKQGAVAVVVNSGQHVRQLQTDEHEHQAIENEFQCLPDRPGLKAHLGRKEFGTPAAEVEPAGHDRQHSRSPHPVSNEVSGVWNQNADGDLDGAVVNAVFNPVRDPADNQADGQTAECQVSQASDATGDRRSLVSQHHGDT